VKISYKGFIFIPIPATDQSTTAIYIPPISFYNNTDKKISAHMARATAPAGFYRPDHESPFVYKFNNGILFCGQSGGVCMVLDY
jgi:hypothetical protein